MRITVWAKPKHARPGITAKPDGSLEVRVAEIPENGKATAAILTTIAKAANVSKTSVRLIAGHTSKWKIVEIDGNEEEISKKLGLGTQQTLT